MSIAGDCKKVVEELGSVKEAADKIGVSPQIIRAVVSLTKLVPEVQEMVKRGDFLFDTAYRLNTIKDQGRQAEIAKMLAGLTNHQQRQLIHQAKKFPDSDLSDFRKRLTTPPNVRRVHIMVIPLDEETHEKVMRISKKLGRPPEKLMADAIVRWASKG